MGARGARTTVLCHDLVWLFNVGTMNDSLAQAAEIVSTAHGRLVRELARVVMKGKPYIRD